MMTQLDFVPRSPGPVSPGRAAAARAGAALQVAGAHDSRAAERPEPAWAPRPPSSWAAAGRLARFLRLGRTRARTPTVSPIIMHECTGTHAGILVRTRRPYTSALARAPKISLPPTPSQALPLPPPLSPSMPPSLLPPPLPLLLSLPPSPIHCTFPSVLFSFPPSPRPSFLSP
jgi:hypothetical protein